MSKLCRSPHYFAALMVLALAGTGRTANPPALAKPSAAEMALFEKEVLPVLQANCFKCHGGGDKLRGGLRLISREGILKGGDLGPAFNAAKPEESRLLQAIHYKEGLEMPPKGKLPAKEIEILTRWVKAGIPWSPNVVAVKVEQGLQGGKVTEESRKYWAYLPLLRPPVPAAQHKERVRSPIDAFLLARLEPRGLTLSEPAGRVALVRRVYYDLLGLPPRPEEVDAFVNDPAADAYEKLIDRLLDSPHYGEKWGRHWLDLVRYAETHGYERDSAKPFAWRYRDYVIDSFNKDKPYDVFLRQQLAGDELPQATPETLVATGFYRLGIWDDEPADRLLARYDVLDGIVSTTAQVVLGMTVGCARCHDHKKDPIPQRDYYRLLAFFRDITDMNVRNTRRLADNQDQQEQQRLARDKQLQEGRLYQQIYALEQQFALVWAKQKGGQALALPASDLVDLTYRFYRDTWDSLPDFDALKFETSGPIASNLISLAPASRGEAIGLVFEGKLKVPKKGQYTFHLESTDGARLIVDGKTLLDRPTRGRHSSSATATLAEGLLPLRLEYFNTYNKPHLQLSWSGPGLARRGLTAGTAEERVLVPDSRQEGQSWNCTFTAPKSEWIQPDFSTAGWQKGPGGFGTRGTPGAVVRTEWNTADIWMRRTFTLDRLPSSLGLSLHHDEDVQIYLNGKQIFKAAGYVAGYVRVPLGPEALAALKTGENVLAVHCHQTIGGQYIDVGLLEAPGENDISELVRRHGLEVLGPEAAQSYLKLTAQLEASRKAKPPETGLEIMCVEERGQAPTNVLIRGNPAAPGERVEAGFPEVLVRGDVKIPTSKRRALADWLTSPANPLPARVLANRLWGYHFGRGLVPTPNDFGKLGEPVTHPELLDWLASELVQGGWRLKRMHKLIMMSNAYQMSSKGSPAGLKLDPANSLWWRYNMRRLGAEEVRDSILAVSGRLNLKAGGPSIYPPIPRAVLAGQSRPGEGWPTSPADEACRRSVYVHIKRSLLVPILSIHDQADTDSSCPVRYTTTVSTQALGMINGEFSNEQAADMAERLRREAPDNLTAQVRRAIRLTTGRQPTDAEVQRDVAFIQQLQAQGKSSAQEALKQYCLLALNTNEFVYLD